MIVAAGAAGGTFMNRFRLITAGVVGALALVFVVQNTQVVNIRFFVWEAAISSVLLILLMLIAGFILGFLVARLTAGR